MERVEIVEVGVRDGLQNEPGVLPTAAKLELIGRLVASGLGRLEVASFVHPERVPAMADAEAVLAGLGPRPGFTAIGLVLNRRGYERARRAGVTEIGMAVAATDAFGLRNQGMDVATALGAWADIAGEARAAGLPAQITISTAFGCPFEGEVAPARVVDLARRAAEAGPVEIALADTIGVADPWLVRRRVEAAKTAAPGIPLRMHFHDTRNTGLANAYASVEAGVDVLDASVGGLGGCPFAPAATGNIGTEDLVYMLERAGFETGYDLAALIEIGRHISAKLGKAPASSLARAGGFPA